jgi:hypothetical protein
MIMTFMERVARARAKRRAREAWISDFIAVATSVATVAMLFVFMFLLCG